MADEAEKTLCMHCWRMRTAPFRWVTLPDAEVKAIRRSGRWTFDTCFRCAKAILGPFEDDPPSPRHHAPPTRQRPRSAGR